jgi:glycolate oxidase
VIRAVEATLKPGFPQDAEAVLIVELEDLEDGIGEDAELVERLLRENGAQDVKRAKDDAERTRIWRARKESFGAIGQLSPSYYVQDGVIPRSKLPEVVDQIAAIGQKYNLTVANVFHAGDGNLHPLILFDYKDAEQVENTHKVGEEILKVCIGYGGTLSGEHGIGLEKRKLMGELYSEADLENMQNLRAFFNPDGRLNPAKIFPTPSRCAETKGVSSQIPAGSPLVGKDESDGLDHAKLVAHKSGIAV